MIKKDIKANDYCGAQMTLEYLLKDFLIEGKQHFAKKLTDDDYEESRISFLKIYNLLINFQDEHPQIFPRFNLKTDLEEYLDKVSDDGCVDFDFKYDHIFEDTLYGGIDLSEIDDPEDDELEYDEDAELDMMFPNKEDDDCWDE